MELRILELFSGIGGMHVAFNLSDLPGKVIAAVDINPVANAVYEDNFPETRILNNNIQNLKATTIQNLQINTILMSPPCQPFTRVGLKLDIADPRSEPFLAVCKLLEQVECVQNVLLENVQGFETSNAHQIFLDTLSRTGFFYREFILTPTQFGVPNTRHRYYCVAKKTNFSFDGGKLWLELPKKRSKIINQIKELIEPDEKVSEEMLLPEKVLRFRYRVLDIVTSDNINTMCFTKAYTHYAEGTGSVYTPLNADKVRQIFGSVTHIESIERTMESQLQRIEELKSLRLRYFTPREVARLMSFPDTFMLGKKTTNNQKYRLLGNSLNVLVVSELIKLFNA